MAQYWLQIVAHFALQFNIEEGVRGQQLRLDRAIGTTTPDVIYRGLNHDQNEGVCIYLDGLSQHLHGNPASVERDRMIRDWLRNNNYEVIEIAASDLYDEEVMSRHFRRLAGYLALPDLRESVKVNKQWFNSSTSNIAISAAAIKRVVLQLVQPRPTDRYVNCLPLVPLKVAAGAFGDPQRISEESVWDDWVSVDIGRKLRPGMFVAKVIGKSMEPKISDGSYCVFSTPVEGSRQGKIVLVQLKNEQDPESGERYTVKRYESEKVVNDDGVWRHVTVTLHPLNNNFQPILLNCEDEGAVSVVAEYLATIDK